ncbi:transcription termination/antitermination protein NusG [Homoserinimonas sp. OAct 916]|uniref:transcription termination/antitermination protein NusG n=1 Tax=Homoserinimonas sp. OAct 916 TaxID=2211450 RepID=UPI000DBEA948|nr:transcription termination/antitermination protein NusG [Homoserinimonas sp. OAct 916]
MSDPHRDDADWATAAEQTSEVEEAQDGDSQAHDIASDQAAEEKAMHNVNEVRTDQEVEAGLEAALDAMDPTVEAEPVVDEELGMNEDPAIDAEVAAAAETTEEEVEADPYEEFRAELRSLPGHWYVIHSYAGFERRVKANIENRKTSLEAEDYIFQVEVPMEDVVEIKNGQRKMVTRVRIPGYVLVRMELNEDSWSVVRHTPGVTGFVGNSHNPTPLRFEEAFSMLKSLVQVQSVPAAKVGGGKGDKAASRVIPAEIDFEIGETITIKEGSFEGLPGSINEIKPESGKLIVLVSLFERETPVELSFDQVTKL